MVPDHPDVTVHEGDLLRAPRRHRPAEERRPLCVQQIGLNLDPGPLLPEVVAGQDGRNRAADRQPVHQILHRIDPRQRVLTDDLVGGHGRIVRGPRPLPLSVLDRLSVVTLRGDIAALMSARSRRTNHRPYPAWD